MRNKHIIALDLDGTVLTNDKKIAPQTKAMIKKLIDEDHIVVIATGRSNRMSIFYYHELELVTPLINSNGAYVHHPQDKSWGKYHTPLNHKTAIEIVEACYELNSKNIIAAVHDSIYLDQFDQTIVNFYESQDDGFIVGRIKEKLLENPTLMMLYPDEKNLDKLTNHLNDLHAEAIDHWNWGAPHHIIEVMNKQMNKAEALKKIANEYGIPKERIIAFGDGANDMEMIDYAGIGVAMGNAIDELKTIAKYITDTNEEYGVANFLANYFELSHPIKS
ncbi:Cof-type HAD-IIB family hydrolase [Pseudogracilibacillus sp. SO30301A]|uniref:Cof-type HAD-IIB family hydrolase n=1 Tax=Pseudogracilibacillus sp. SO30301A TaxID=3098291 RepID=UPI00300E2C9E